MRTSLVPLLALTLTGLASAQRELPAFLRSYPIPTGTGGSGTQAKLITDDYDANGVPDVAFTRRPSGTPSSVTPGLLIAAHEYSIAASMLGEAVDLAVLPDSTPEGTGRLLGVLNSVVVRWGWEGALQRMIPIDSFGGPWGSAPLTAISAAASPAATLDWVAVAADTAQGSGIYSMRFLGDTLFAHYASFQLTVDVLALHQIDVDDDGLADELGVVTTNGLTLYEMDGTLIQSFAGTNLLVAPFPKSGGQRLACVSGAAGAQSLTIVGSQIEGTFPLDPTWNVTGIAAGPVDADALSDVVLGLGSLGRVAVLWNDQGSFDYQTADEIFLEDHYQAVTPSLADHDHDGDLDVLVVADDSVHVLLGTLVDEDEHKPNMTIGLGDGGGQGGGGGGKSLELEAPAVGPILSVSFQTIDPPPSPDALILYVVHGQPEFDLDGEPTFVMSGFWDDIEPGASNQLDLPQFEVPGIPSAWSVFYVELSYYIPDPREVLPISSLLIVEDDPLGQGPYLTMICAELNEDCEDKGTVGVVRLSGGLPPPIITVPPPPPSG